MRLRGSRTYLSVRVGEHHTADCILHVRRKDLDWFNSDAKLHCDELFRLLSTSVLPRIFYDEVEDFNYRVTGETKPPPLGVGGLPIDVGERNMTSRSTKNITTNTSANQQSKRKRNRGANVAAASAKKVAAEINLKESSKRNETGIFYSFGETMQLTYCLLENSKHKSKPAVTLVFNDDKKVVGNNLDHGKNEGSFRQLITLSKQIIVWCYPYDPNRPNEPDPEDGMPRPEMVPLSDLFREPTHTEK